MDFDLIKRAALQYVILLLSLSVHEAAHAWTSNRFGDPTAKALGRVSLNPLVHIDIIGTVLFPIIQIFTGFPIIGWAKPVPVNPLNLKDPRKDDLWISFSGPASNLLLGLSFFIFAFLLVRIGIITPYDQVNAATYLITSFLIYGILINFLLAAFNLIPIPPLDGSGILMGILPEKTALSVERIGPYGFLIILVLFYIGVLEYIIFRPVLFIFSFLITVAGM